MRSNFVFRRLKNWTGAILPFELLPFSLQHKRAALQFGVSFSESATARCDAVHSFAHVASLIYSGTLRNVSET